MPDFNCFVMAEWLDQLNRNANGQVLLTLPELDAAGYAQVVAVEPCPAIASGPGRVVLGTFHHSAGDVYDVWLSDGSQLGVTARPPVWSVDRGEWVSVGDLEPGETLETLHGTVRVACEIAWFALGLRSLLFRDRGGRRRRNRPARY